MLIAMAKTKARAMIRDGKMSWLLGPAKVIWYQFKNVRDWLHMDSVRRALRQEIPRDVESQIDLVMLGLGGALRPIQNRRELRALIDRVKELQPKTVLEIGTAKGGTLFLLCQAAAPDATIISLDLPFGRNGGGFPAWKEPVYHAFGKPGQTVHLIRGDSHDPASLAKVEEILSGAPLEFLMIDGDHSFEGVKADFDSYGPLVSKDGFIAVHDILENRFDPSIDVHRFWEEVRTGHVTEELIDDPNQGNLGIGIVHGFAGADRTHSI